LNGSCDSIAELAPTSRRLPGPAAAGPILAVSPKIIHNFEPSTTLTPRSAPPMPKARARWSMRLQMKVGPVSTCCPATPTGNSMKGKRKATAMRQNAPVLWPGLNAQQIEVVITCFKHFSLSAIHETIMSEKRSMIGNKSRQDQTRCSLEPHFVQNCCASGFSFSHFTQQTVRVVRGVLSLVGCGLVFVCQATRPQL